MKIKRYIAGFIFQRGTITHRFGCCGSEYSFVLVRYSFNGVPFWQGEFFLN